MRSNGWLIFARAIFSIKWKNTEIDRPMRHGNETLRLPHPILALITGDARKYHSGCVMDPRAQGATSSILFHTILRVLQTAEFPKWAILPWASDDV